MSVYSQCRKYVFNREEVQRAGLSTIDGIQIVVNSSPECPQTTRCVWVIWRLITTNDASQTRVAGDIAAEMVPSFTSVRIHSLTRGCWRSWSGTAVHHHHTTMMMTRSPLIIIVIIIVVKFVLCPLPCQCKWIRLISRMGYKLTIRIRGKSSI